MSNVLRTSRKVTGLGVWAMNSNPPPLTTHSAMLTVPGDISSGTFATPGSRVVSASFRGLGQRSTKHQVQTIARLSFARVFTHIVTWGMGRYGHKNPWMLSEHHSLWHSAATKGNMDSLASARFGINAGIKNEARRACEGLMA